jgi:hypothetical protein
MYTAAGNAGGAGSLAVTLLIIAVAFALYWTPTIVAVIRRRVLPNLGSIIVINALLGWTVVFWILALAYAVRSPVQPQHASSGPVR